MFEFSCVEDLNDQYELTLNFNSDRAVIKFEVTTSNRTIVDGPIGGFSSNYCYGTLGFGWDGNRVTFYSSIDAEPPCELSATISQTLVLTDTELKSFRSCIREWEKLEHRSTSDSDDDSDDSDSDSDDDSDDD